MGASYYCAMCHDYHEPDFHVLPVNHPMRVAELILEPSPPRTYPTNYFDNRFGMPPRERHTHYWDGSPVKYE